MNDAVEAVVEAQSKKVSCSSKARQYKSSAPRTWLEWTPAQKSLCVQLFLDGNYNHVVLLCGCQLSSQPHRGGDDKELKYEAAVIDLDTLAALGLLHVLDLQWAASRHKMGCYKKITTE